jgi:carboxymethylenebutenolidase
VTEIAGLRNYPFGRRGILMTGLISAFTLATQRVEAQVIHTDSTEIEAGATEIPTTDGNPPAY